MVAAPSTIMRRISFVLIALMVLGGVASADRERWRRHRDGSDRSGGTVVRDHRYRDTVRVNQDRPRYYNNHNRVRVERRPVYLSNNRFVFNGGVTRHYQRPVIRQRYYDYRYRPQLIVEHCEPVPGYIWIQGHWHWSGYEWIWTNGYYAPDQNYQDSHYDDGYYGNSGYYDSSGYDDSGYDNSGYDNSGYYGNGVRVEGSVRLGL